MILPVRISLTCAFVIVVALAALVPSADAAADRKLLGSFRDWDAYVLDTGGKRECYMISLPKETRPHNVRRGKIYVMVAHRPAAAVSNEVSVIVGYPFRKNSTATAIVDGRSFQMFTQGDSAWLYDAKQDAAMVAAMKKGARLTVKGTSSRGTRTTDRYSLMGFTAAYKAISRACKVN